MDESFENIHMVFGYCVVVVGGGGATFALMMMKYNCDR